MQVIVSEFLISSQAILANPKKWNVQKISECGMVSVC